MPAPLLNTASSQRLDLTDLTYLAQDQPTAMQSSLMGVFASGANASQSIYILYGFGGTAGVGSTSTSPAQNQLQIAPGSGIMAWRRDAGTPRFGQLVDLDGTGQVAQSVDFTYFPSSSYTIWLRMTYTPGSQTDRTFWNSAEPGFEFSQITNTRLVATWEIQALSTGSSPGSEWVAIAQVVWTAPSAQGGVGSLNNLQDTRPLYFEGRANSSTPFGSSWGSTQDRSANRSTVGVRDLRTMLDAIKTSIEDLKGPSLRRWWDPGMGGLNVGFVPNTPLERRVAVGDTGFFLQGRTTGAPNDAFLSVKGDGSTPNITGLHVQADRVRWLNGNSAAPMWTISSFGTMGFGNLAETDIYSTPGRALVEMVVSASGQDTLRLGARASNSAVPVNIPVTLNVVAPDQSNNIAQVWFTRGGVQGPEQRMYAVGKGNNNHFHLFDSVNGSLFLDYDSTAMNLTFAARSFSFFDVANNRNAISYSSATSTTSVSGTVSVAGTVSAGVVASVSSITTGQASGNTLRAGTSASSPTFNVDGSQALLSADKLVLPIRAGVPPGAPYGSMYYDSNLKKIYFYTQAATGSDDNQPVGWRAI